jgi:hypothetical protein
MEVFRRLALHRNSGRIQAGLIDASFGRKPVAGVVDIDTGAIDPVRVEKAGSSRGTPRGTVARMMAPLRPGGSRCAHNDEVNRRAN